MKLIFLCILLNLGKTAYSESNNDSLLAENYFNRAKLFDNGNNIDSSNYFYNMSAKLFEQLANQKDLRLPEPTVRYYWTKYFLCYNMLAWNMLIYFADYAGAFNLMNKKIVLAKEILGKESLLIARYLDRIGTITSYMGKYSESLQYYHESLLIIDKSDENGGESLKAMVYNNLGTLNQECGNYDLSWEYLIKSLNIRKKLYGENNNLVATNYANLATVLRIKGDYYTAAEYDKKALRMLLNIVGEINPNVALLYNNMGINYMLLKEYDESLKCYSKSLEIKKTLFGEEHVEIGVVLTNIANVYHLKNNYDIALEHHLTALDMQYKTLTPLHLVLGKSLINIGLLYMDKKDYEKSLYYIDESMKIFNFNFANKHPQKGIIYYTYARLYYMKGELDKARFYCDQAIKELITDSEKIDIYLNPVTAENESAAKQLNLDSISDALALLEVLSFKAKISEQLFAYKY